MVPFGEDINTPSFGSANCLVVEGDDGKKYIAVFLLNGLMTRKATNGIYYADGSPARMEDYDHCEWTGVLEGALKVHIAYVPDDGVCGNSYTEGIEEDCCMPFYWNHDSKSGPLMGPVGSPEKCDPKQMGVVGAFGYGNPSSCFCESASDDPTFDEGCWQSTKQPWERLSKSGGMYVQTGCGLIEEGGDKLPCTRHIFNTFSMADFSGNFLQSGSQVNGGGASVGLINPLKGLANIHVPDVTIGGHCPGPGFMNDGGVVVGNQESCECPNCCKIIKDVYEEMKTKFPDWNALKFFTEEYAIINGALKKCAC